MTSIHPFTVICFALCAGLLLSLWPRRSASGAVTVLAASAAMWAAIALRLLDGPVLERVAVSLALLQFVPPLFLKAVLDHLADYLLCS